MREPVDHAARRAALDPARSFIVQAPAGSGKTELLTQRLLRLLATVDEPEEILAITFTRKAAGEMRERVLSALEAAAHEGEPPADHRLETWRLAREVHDRDTARGWHLLASPARLRVMTIDALHAMLSRQMPILSGAGGDLAISEQPQELYRTAVRRALRRLLEDEDETAALGLLRHLDNRFERAEAMLVDLLARRDQWLPRISGPGSMGEDQRRAWLEQSLRHQVEADLALADQACPASVRDALPQLAAYAARNLQRQGSDSLITACADLTSWPAPAADAIPVWTGLAELLLTRSRPASWRKQLTKNQGFPPAGGDEKATLLALLESLADAASFGELLAEVRTLPPVTYDEAQWRMLDHLLRLLPHCAAELDLVIGEQGAADYVAVARAARQALDAGDGPTDLALALDYRLRHILVDEFQDTSVGQVGLLRLLTEGWAPDDGRTVFFVGDPMQSIYGFREAEVGLFLQIRQRRRLNQVPIEPLTLEVNFRSDAGLVAWVNAVLESAMPHHEESRLGAVRFVPASAHHGPGAGPAVTCHAFENDDGDAEASRLLEVVGQIRAREPEATIALLVRARNHLQSIARRMKVAGVRFQAVEIEKLVERPVIQDLIALTRALCHLADRTAWLAVYRAPWCGLRLADLLTIAGGPGATVRDNTRDPTVLECLDPAARTRVRRVSAILEAALGARSRRPLHRLVEGTWLALGGGATVAGADDLEDARGYFLRLAALQTAGDLKDVSTLEARLTDLYAVPDPGADSRLQLMTIHKAKGLQFDHVLLPGLHRGVGGNDPRLLHWLEVPRSDAESDLLLATIGERGGDKDPLHQYLKRQEDKKADYELGRLLYVAVTRARRTLHLFASLASAERGGEQRLSDPRRGTFLQLLWAATSQQFLQALEPMNDSVVAAAGEREPARLWRLVDGWQVPEAPSAVLPEPAGRAWHGATLDVEFWWAGRPGRAVGTVVHRWLERIAADGLERWDRGRLPEIRDRVGHMLTEQGLDGATRRAAREQVMQALATTLSDARGRWILSDTHDAAACEWEVAGVVDHEVIHLKIDRLFRAADGTRWIIDYKTGRHTGADLDAFLEREVERYRAQLARYAQLVAGLYPDDPIRVGLYFPLHAAWRSWDPFANPAGGA